jgi:hypothetical protein
MFTISPIRLHWRESTVTSPSGRHLGIYRSLVTAYCDSSGEFSTRPDLDADSPASDLTVQEQAEEIPHVIFGLAESAARLGFYLQQWTQVINVMIYKKPGCIELDKLRVIHLFEADFNLLVGLFFGRRAMHHQVDHNLLHEGQFGKPGGECQDTAFSKILTNMVSHFSKTPIGQSYALHSHLLQINGHPYGTAPHVGTVPCQRRPSRQDRLRSLQGQLPVL